MTSGAEARREREQFLRALLGSPPSPGAVLRVATNHAPERGVAEGTWTEAAAPSVEAAVDLLTRNADRGDTYIGLAWFRPEAAKLKRGVIGRRWVSAEVDDKSMPGATVEERRQQACSLATCLPCPSVVVASGGGFHIHVLLPEAWRVESFEAAEEGVERVEAAGRALRLYLEDRSVEVVGRRVALDHVHGAERVWRVPPSRNAKAGDGQRQLTSDSSLWRPVLLKTPGRPEGLELVAVADVSFLIPFMQAAEEEVDRGGKPPQVATIDVVSLGGRPLLETSVATFQGVQVAFSASLLPPRLQRSWPQDASNQSDHDFAVASALAEAGWAPVVAAEGVRVRRSLLRDPGDREKGLRDEYVRQTVAKAYARAAVPTPPPSAKPFVPFPVELLPSPIAEFIEAGRKAMTCPAEGLVLPLLTALGAAIGNSRRIQLKNSWSEPPLLWSCVVMGSGKTKSPAQELALRPHQARQKRAFAAYKVALKRYAAQKLEHKKVLKAWEKADEEAGEAPTAPEKPVLFRLLVAEATIEAITPILEENPRGLLLVRDELSGWMKSFDAYRSGRGGDREHWLSAHRAHPIMVDRKTDREARFVEHGFIAICGGTQPGILRGLCTMEAFQSGLVARLLLAWPESPRKQWNDDDIPRRLQSAVERLFERILGLELGVPSNGTLGFAGEKTEGAATPSPVLVPLAAEAKELWCAFYNEFAIEQEGVESDEALAAAFAKLEGYAARFALILEHVLWAASQRAEPPTLIGAEAMRAGIAMARWFAAEATRIYALLEESALSRRRTNLITWIAAQGRPTTVHDVVRGPRVYRQDVGGAESDLEELVARGLAWRLPVTPMKGGRATTAYVLRAHVSPLERGDDRSRELSVDKDLRSRVSPAPPDSAEGGNS